MKAPEPVRFIERLDPTDDHVGGYPPPGCGGGVGCSECPQFLCARCRQWQPFCAGAGDAHPRWCDVCFHRMHGKRSACRKCRAHDRELYRSISRRLRQRKTT